MPSNPFGRSRRGGAVLVIAIACIAVASVIFLAILKTAVAERGAMRTLQWREQAGWLVESGLERAAARLTADPAYPGETWKIPAGQLGLGQVDAAVVRIAVEPVGEGVSEMRIDFGPGYRA